MGIVLLVLLLALLFVGLGFVAHLLWIIAVIVIIVWAVGWAIGKAESGGRRRWYGRW